MFSKIFVALDRSSQAEAVFNFALSIAPPEISQMLLVHFIDWQMQDVSPWVGAATLFDVDASGTRYDWSRQRLQEEVVNSDRLLGSYADRAIAKNIDCKFESRIGNCNLGIGDRAREWRADVIVMGRRGHRNVSEILLGSVSNYVIHHAPCSILVVQGPTADATVNV